MGQILIKCPVSTSEKLSPEFSVSIVLLSGEPLATVACTPSGLTFCELWQEASDPVLTFVGRWPNHRPWQLLLGADDIDANVIDIGEFVDEHGTIVKSPEFLIPCGSQLQLLVQDPWSEYRGGLKAALGV